MPSGERPTNGAANTLNGTSRAGIGLASASRIGAGIFASNPSFGVRGADVADRRHVTFARPDREARPLHPHVDVVEPAVPLVTGRIVAEHVVAAVLPDDARERFVQVVVIDGGEPAGVFRDAAEAVLAVTHGIEHRPHRIGLVGQRLELDRFVEPGADPARVDPVNGHVGAIRRGDDRRHRACGRHPHREPTDCRCRSRRLRRTR